MTYTVERPNDRAKAHPMNDWFRVVEPDGSTVAYVPDEPTARQFAAAPDMHAEIALALRYLEHPDVQGLPFAMPVGALTERVRALLATIDGKE